MKKMTLDEIADAKLRGKRVLVRVDFNVPLEDGSVTDDTRIRAALPTIEHLVERSAHVVLISHLGRPKGTWVPELSLKPAASRLRSLLDTPVRFVDDVTGADAQSAVAGIGDGEIVMLENARFLAGEETNDHKLSESLAAFADVYVNDAFGAAHRAHASTCGVAEVVKGRGDPAVAGFLIKKELRFLRDAIDSPKRPFISILGGAKISGKIDVIEHLLEKVDRLLIGGAMANTFFRALGLETGESLVEEDRVGLAGELLERAGDKLLLPVDCVVAADSRSGEDADTAERDAVPQDMSILDIGPKSVRIFCDVIEDARTILWNGPMGMFEVEPFGRGSDAIAHGVATATDRGAESIVGGGDTAAAVRRAELSDRMTHVSTGGGASLEFLGGKALPGVAVLSDSEEEGR